MRYDLACHSLDRHATYIVAAFVAGASRTSWPARRAIPNTDIARHRRFPSASRRHPRCTFPSADRQSCAARFGRSRRRPTGRSRLSDHCQRRSFVQRCRVKPGLAFVVSAELL